MCIHYMYYGNEYGYLSNFFDNGVYFGINNMLKYENISRDEKQLCIFNRYMAKIDIFKCILDLDIAGKPIYVGKYFPLQNNGFIILKGRYCSVFNIYWQRGI